MIHTVELGGHTWWWLSRRYRTERGALKAFNDLQAEGQHHHGDLELGVYRHTPDRDQPATVITVVSHRPEGMETAERILGLGDPYPLDAVNLEALIIRRARVLEGLLAAGASPGSYAIRRPPGRGARVYRDGTFGEPVGGDE